MIKKPLETTNRTEKTCLSNILKKKIESLKKFQVIAPKIKLSKKEIGNAADKTLMPLQDRNRRS